MKITCKSGVKPPAFALLIAPKHETSREEAQKQHLTFSIIELGGTHAMKYVLAHF